MIHDAIIVAAGRGKRFSSKIPKQFVYLHHKRIIEYSILCLSKHNKIRHIYVTYHPDDQEIIQELKKKYPHLVFIKGGEERQQSVYNALRYIAQLDQTPDTVLIHDAARPFITEELIDRLIEAILTQGVVGVFPAIAVKDCLREKTPPSFITHDRNRFLLVQTPQAFYFKDILRQHTAHKNHTLHDDIALLEKDQLPLTSIEGYEQNFKITTQNDFLRAFQMMQHVPYIPKTTMGVDVHAFGEGNFITLCGQEIPHTHGLVGHSDADVGYHALADALYALICDGDIGQHFPSHDTNHKGKDSSIFVAHAYKRIAEHNVIITHVDITFICERPILTPFRDKMRANVAELLHIPLHYISIKATTTDKLGFTGRKEGLTGLCQVTALFPQQA